MATVARAVALLVLTLLCAPAHGQESTGAIDTREALDEQILSLERSLSGDVAAEKQAVVLRWLADLYASAGQLDRAEQSFERILVFFPGDVATSNAFATFLLDRRDDAARAEQTLHDALQWAAASQTPPPYLGRTYALRARALLALGRHDDALRSADHAVELLDEDAAEDALRVRAQCFTELGRTEDARAAYLSLIGMTGASNPDDAAALIGLLSASTPVDARKFDATVAGAIADARRARVDAAKREGASIVELTGQGNVRIEATLRRAGQPAAILFVPDAGGRRSEFIPYAQLISVDGVTTLAVDPRGHGDSRSDSIPSFDAMSPRQREQLPSDIALAWRYLRDTIHIAPARIAIVAEGRACALVERALHENGVDAIVVHLSPVFDPEDLELTTALSFHPPRPMLAVASSEDAFAMRSLNVLTNARVTPAGGSPLVETVVFQFAGRGAQILRDPANFAVVLGWTREALALPE